ncbi:Putative lactate dehydrogenase [Elusimicrobium minutum Pei191]|uniref:Putative lactate dehydrogenase n=1 Tax=Elusimicrobium minutum (strain Pei191) TaxID=445932 RepID=B2KDH0_ELUMP|nr:hydroxyacid dehydrogenase [Elusimicrobium minutum]ACC98566.1 Putative lactate dehydrogenase [Elusimicrobium minutum Pei191]
MKIVFFDLDEIKPDKEILDGSNVNVEVIELSKNVFETDENDNVFDAEGISLFSTSRKIGSDILSKFPNLKFISVRSTGFDAIDTTYCKEKSIRVFNVPRYGETTVAEYTIGMIFALTRNIVRANNDMKDRNQLDIKSYSSRDLEAWTLGVLGAGAIGRSVINKAQCLGMNVIAYDPYPSKDFPNIKYVSLEELIKNSDIISLHVPSTKENYHMIGEENFKKMKKGVYIINTARGDLIDNKALYGALLSGHVAGTALDVLEEEGLMVGDDTLGMLAQRTKEELFTYSINTKLMNLDNVIVTPHIAFDTLDARKRIMTQTCKNIAGYYNAELEKPSEPKI